MSLVSLLGLFACAKNYTDLSIDEFADSMAAEKLAVLDIRTPQEYAAGHLRGAANCDWYAPDFMTLMEETYPKDTPLAIYCRSGKRSAAAAKKLAKAGYTVSNMLGGYLAWTEAGKPVTTYEVETFFTEGGYPLSLTLIKHGSLALSYKGKSIQVDPVGAYGKPTDYAQEFPKADLILLTHEHADHLDKDAIEALFEEGKTSLVTNARCREILGWGTALSNGESMQVLDGRGWKPFRPTTTRKGVRSSTQKDGTMALS